MLSADYFDEQAVSDEDIRHITSVLTVVGGRVVHDTGVLRPESVGDNASESGARTQL